MVLLNVCINIMLFLGVCSGYFLISTNDDNLQCKSSGVECLTNTSFTTCVNMDNLTILNKILHCDDGCYCDDSSDTPCKCPTSSTTTTTTTSTTSTTTESPQTSSTNSITSTQGEIGTTTVSTTTKKIVVRPTGAPTCNAAGFHAAPACNQYYECSQATTWFIFVYYEPVLKTCIDGDYFDTGLLQCVLAASSDCAQ